MVSIGLCINMFDEHPQKIMIPTSALEENAFVNYNVTFTDCLKNPHIILKLYELALCCARQGQVTGNTLILLNKPYK